MIRIQEAVEKFKGSYQCSQAILETYGEEYNLDSETALKMATAFGGGISHFGDKCGAVMASLMIIGLKYGNSNTEDKETRQLVYDKTHEFVKRFKEVHKSIECRDLLGYDFSTPEGDEAIHEQNLCDILCPNYVKTSAEILEDI